MTIRDLNRATDWNLPDEEANTVAGLVIHEAQMIPNQGQVFSLPRLPLRGRPAQGQPADPAEDPQALIVWRRAST
jgi:CBS domain containing-hemolysin-like protein